jgi:hypothetical protein
VNGPDRARVGCFAGCARIPSHFRSRVCSDSRSIDGYSNASDEGGGAFLRIDGAVRPAEGVKWIGQSGGESWRTSLHIEGLCGRTTTGTIVCSKRQLQGQENSCRPKKRARFQGHRRLYSTFRWTRAYRPRHGGHHSSSSRLASDSYRRPPQN